MSQFADYLYMVEGGERKVSLTPEEEVTVLHLYDYGLGAITEPEVKELNAIIAKIKDQIHS